MWNVLNTVEDFDMLDPYECFGSYSCSLGCYKKHKGKLACSKIFIHIFTWAVALLQRDVSYHINKCFVFFLFADTCLPVDKPAPSNPETKTAVSTGTVTFLSSALGLYGLFTK